VPGGVRALTDVPPARADRGRAWLYRVAARNRIGWGEVRNDVPHQDSCPSQRE